MTNRNIWYVSKYVTPSGAGVAGARGYLLMKELALLGHCVTIITSDSNHLLATMPRIDGKYLFQESDNLQLCWVKTLKYSAAKSMRRIFSWIHFEWRLLHLPRHKIPKPDVVVVSSLSLLTIFNGLRWRIIYKCRLIFEVRDIWPLTIIEEGGFKKFNPFVWGLGVVERLAYKYADVIVGTMPNLGEHVHAVLGYPKLTYCVPMGVDPSMFKKDSAEITEQEISYFPKEKFVVAHVGSIGISNALNTFLECAQSMKDDEDIHFLLVGEGDLRDSYQSMYAHLRNVTFAPRVPKNRVQIILSQCDLLYFSVHPSKVWRYGQSLNKVIDYMMAGKPIVASYSGYPSMINEAMCGSYTPAGDITLLAKEIKNYAALSKHERDQIGAKGKAWVLENRAYSKLAKEYLNIMFDTNRAV